MNDVRVIGVKTGTILIADIAVDVPHGVVVSIPAEKAHVSKDLYRYISQKLLFQVHPGPVNGPLPRALPDMAPVVAPTKAPQAREAALDAQVQLLRTALEEREQMFMAALAAQQDKLDKLVTAIAERPVTIYNTTHTTPAPKQVVEGPSGDAPMFIPSTIKSKDMEDTSHVSVQSDSQENSSVSGAAAALKKLRQSNNQ